MDAATRRPRRHPAPVGSPSRRGQRNDVPLERCLFHLQPALPPRNKGACSEFHCIHLSLTAAPRNRECARVARPCIVQDAIISPPPVPMTLVSALATQALGWYKCSMPGSGRRKKAPNHSRKGARSNGGPTRAPSGTHELRAQAARKVRGMNLGSNLLPGRFVQHLRILRWVVVVHVVQIEEAARGNLAPGKDAPSEEEALECLIRIFEGSHAETDRRLIEEYMAARTWEWWQGYPERRLFSDLAERADHRKRWTGTRDSRRPPSREEGLRVARPLLAGIPDEITLDAMGEYESAARLLGSILLPPYGRAVPRKAANSCRAS